jgi:hypothetical protein
MKAKEKLDDALKHRVKVNKKPPESSRERKKKGAIEPTKKKHNHNLLTLCSPRRR